MSPLEKHAALAAGGGARERTTSFHQVLILLAAYFFGVGSCGSQSVKQRVDEAIKSEARKPAAVALAREIDSMVEQHLEAILSLRNALDETAARYDATPEELYAASEAGIVAAESIEARLLDARFRLRDLMKKKEWKELFEHSKPPGDR